MDLTKVFNQAKNALEILWTGTLKVVVVDRTEKDPVTKVEKPIEKTLYDEIPCHLSFKGTSLSTEYKTDSAAAEMILFVGPDIRIPTNSKIIVKQSGETFRLKNERLKPYKSHNEYEVTENESWSRF